MIKKIFLGVGIGMAIVCASSPLVIVAAIVYGSANAQRLRTEGRPLAEALSAATEPMAMVGIMPFVLYPLAFVFFVFAAKANWIQSRMIWYMLLACGTIFLPLFPWGSMLSILCLVVLVSKRNLFLKALEQKGIERG